MSLLKSGPKLQFVDTPNVRVGYFEYGNPAGVPVVMLHGFPDSPMAYEGVIERLDLKKLRVFVPYLRGFGATQVKPAELVGGQEAALGHDLLGFADGLGLARFHLVGHDWGARTAYAACVFAPGRVKSLLTMATPYVMYGGKEYPPDQVRGNWYQWYFQLEHGRKAMEENAEAFCRELWRAWSPEWKFSGAEFKRAAEAWKNPQFVATVIHYYRTRWGGALSLRGYAELQAQLNAEPKPKISVPTVYVQGGADACDLTAGSDGQEKWFSGKYERVVMKGVGHFPHREDPKGVAGVLKRLLARYA